MNWKDIEDYLQNYPQFIKKIVEGKLHYCITTVNYMTNDPNDRNTATVITLDNTGIKCRRLRRLTGILYATDRVEVTNLSELKEFLNESIDSINEYIKAEKEYKITTKLEKIKEDFK